MAGRLRGMPQGSQALEEGILVAGGPGAKQTDQCETRSCPLIAAGATAHLANCHQWTEAAFRQIVVSWQIGYEHKLEQLILMPHQVFGQCATRVLIAQGVLPPQLANLRDEVFIFSLPLLVRRLWVLLQPALGILIQLPHRSRPRHYLNGRGMGFPEFVQIAQPMHPAALVLAKD